MYSNTAVRASSRVRKRAWWTCSFLSEAKKLSIGPLSRQSPLRLIDCPTPCRRSPLREGSAPYCLVSTGRRNSSLTGLQHRVEGLGGRSPPERLARSAVEGGGHGREVLRAVPAQVGALREVLPQEPVGVLVRPALPRGVRVAEVDL